MSEIAAARGGGIGSMNSLTPCTRPSALSPLREERGTVLLMALIATLLLLIMAASFTALGGLEAKIGINDAGEKRAGMIAEAGLEAVRSQVQNPTDYTAFLDGRIYECTPSACTCSTGCDVTRLASVSTGTFRVMIQNDPDDPSPTVDTNSRAILTAYGETTDGRGRARVRGWLTRDDPWRHVCSSGDGVLCIDPPNNPNADITPPDPNNMNGPRTYPQIPVPNQIRCTPVPGGNFTTPGFPDKYPVPNGVTVPGAPLGPCVMYPYYETALKTPCSQCSAATVTSAYDPASCNTGAACLGMVRVEADVSMQSNPGGSGAKMVVPGGTLGSVTAPATVYVMGKLDVKGGVNIYGTLILHGNGVSATDLLFQGPHTVTTVLPGAGVPHSYPLAILGYNPNEGAPPAQTIVLNISSANLFITGMVYTGGTVDFNPATITGTVMGYTVNANNAATHFTYTSAYENAIPPPGFSTPALTLPSVIASGTWLKCRRADSLAAVCD